jgi:hypothetical protein
MIEISITGFQSIEHVDLKIDRFTALVGRSNIGKSAIVRAVKAALTGAAGTDFVRHNPRTCTRVLKGTKKCKCKAEVRVKMPELEFLWEKGDADNRYTVQRDGKEEVFDKLDRGTPEFLTPDFTPIKVGDSSTLINVGDQFDPIFLLGDAGSAVADVLSDVAKLDSLNAALKLVAKDKQQCSSTLKVREQDALLTAAKLAGYDDLPDLLALAATLGSRWESIQQAQAHHTYLTGLLARTAALVQEVKSLEAVVAVGIPATRPLQALSSQVGDACRLLAEYHGCQQSLACIQALLDIKVPVTDSLDASRVKLAQMSGWLVRSLPILRDVGVLTKLSDLPIPEATSLQAKSAQLGKLAKWVKPAQDLMLTCRQLQALVDMPIPDAPEVDSKAKQLLAYEGLYQRVVPLAKEVQGLEGTLQSATRDLEASLKELSELAVCPTCGRPVGDEHEASISH